jgi:hypothetical protein
MIMCWQLVIDPIAQDKRFNLADLKIPLQLEHVELSCGSLGCSLSDGHCACGFGMGFKKEGRHYRHPDCPHLFVEFPPGPLGIGEDTKVKPMEKREEGFTFKILSPTDCIRDRLASYIHFKSREGLDQAILVAH